MATTTEQTTKGGAWLLDETAPSSVMTPEQLTDEHRLIAQTAAEFIDNEVLPAKDRLEQKDWALNRELLAKCGALGLLGTNVSGRVRRRRSRQDLRARRIGSSSRGAHRSARPLARRAT